jgi:hypothetical protein
MAGSWLPLPLGDPQRSFGLFGELIANSTIPLAALVFLYLGFGGDSLPALWECRLAATLRPLLRAVAILYLLTAFTFFGLGRQLEIRGVKNLQTQVQNNLAGLQRFRQAVDSAADSAELNRLVDQLPGLRQALAEEKGAASLPDQRNRTDKILDRFETNLRLQAQRQRAELSGSLMRQSLRFGASAVVYAIFFLFASISWPRSLAATRARVLDARAERLREEEGEDPPGREP